VRIPAQDVVNCVVTSFAKTPFAAAQRPDRAAGMIHCGSNDEDGEGFVGAEAEEVWVDMILALREGTRMEIFRFFSMKGWRDPSTSD
jgi:hypothetical protein